nr:hypothetical protein Iba_chr03aCG1150 [Ipomoea batatas]
MASPLRATLSLSKYAYMECFALIGVLLTSKRDLRSYGHHESIILDLLKRLKHNPAEIENPTFRPAGKARFETGETDEPKPNPARNRAPEEEMRVEMRVEQIGQKWVNYIAGKRKAVDESGVSVHRRGSDTWKWLTGRRVAASCPDPKDMSWIAISPECVVEEGNHSILRMFSQYVGPTFCI